MSSTTVLNNTIFDQQKLTQAQVYSDFQTLFNNIKGYIPQSGETWDMLMLLMATSVSSIQDVIIANNKNLTTTYAKGAYLDFIGKIYGVPRIINSFASVSIDINFTGGDSFTLYSGFTVQNADGLSFVLQSNTVIPSGLTSGSYLFEAINAGSAYNGIAIGTINVITTPNPNIISASNDTISSGGVDYETDADYVLRLNDSKNYLSAAGNVRTYYSQLYENFPQILNAYIVQPVTDPGYVDIYIILQGGTLSDITLKTEIINYFNIYGPLTDTVRVQDPDLVNITIGLTVNDSGMSSEEKNNLFNSLQSYYSKYIIADGSGVGNFYVANVTRIALNSSANAVNAVLTAGTTTDQILNVGQVLNVTVNPIIYIPTT